MRFYDLKGLSDETASTLIAKCPKVEVKEVLDNPKILSKKISKKKFMLSNQNMKPKMGQLR